MINKTSIFIFLIILLNQRTVLAQEVKKDSLLGVWISNKSGDNRSIKFNKQDDSKPYYFLTNVNGWGGEYIIRKNKILAKMRWQHGGWEEKYKIKYDKNGKLYLKRKGEIFEKK